MLMLPQLITVGFHDANMLSVAIASCTRIHCGHNAHKLWTGWYGVPYDTTAEPPLQRLLNGAALQH